MTFKELASAISKQEGKKHQASVGDVREILKLVFNKAHEHNLGFLELLARELKKRDKKPKA